MRRIKNNACHDLMEVVGDALVRDVCPPYGKPYSHTCYLGVFQDVCHCIDECNGRPFTGEDLVGWTGEPSTQVFTALAFLKERGIVESARGRRNVVSTISDVFLDGMVEWSASAAGAAS